MAWTQSCDDEQDSVSNNKAGITTSKARHMDWIQSCKKKRARESKYEASITTLMVRNIPAKMNLVDIMRVFDDNGFAGTYDFLHMPGRGRPFCNLGYAFINFVADGAPELFMETFHGVPVREVTDIDTSKILQIHPARKQGFAANASVVRHMMFNSENLYIIGQRISL